MVLGSGWDWLDNSNLWLTLRYNHDYAFSMKTAISIPDPVFESAEAFLHFAGASGNILLKKTL